MNSDTQDQLPNGTVLKGAVKALHGDWGFITGDDGIDRFFHKSMLVNRAIDELAVHERVEFTHQNAAKGPRATDVVVVVGRRPRTKEGALR